MSTSGDSHRDKFANAQDASRSVAGTPRTSRNRPVHTPLGQPERPWRCLAGLLGEAFEGEQDLVFAGVDTDDLAIRKAVYDAAYMAPGAGERH